MASQRRLRWWELPVLLAVWVGAVLLLWQFSRLFAWVVLALGSIWLLLTAWGYLLGPQGGPALTRRDHRILERRANYDTSRKGRMVLDSYEAAAQVTRDARRLKAESARYSDNDAMILALGLVAARIRDVRDRPHRPAVRDYAHEQASERFSLLLRALVQRGVINDLDEPLTSYGLTTEAVLNDPPLLVRLLTVRSLNHWPID